ncbi:hypothetical protein L580_2502 [Serratia fonticola AU-P3(3)]|nr:hypothetical protein L580_2502 [Serratia fonticola AU-P3(3)]
MKRKQIPVPHKIYSQGQILHLPALRSDNRHKLYFEQQCL